MKVPRVVDLQVYRLAQCLGESYEVVYFTLFREGLEEDQEIDFENIINKCHMLGSK